MCLHGLLESITGVDIDDVATLFSGMVMTALLVDTNSAINYIHQACPIVSINEYPGEECVWLCDMHEHCDADAEWEGQKERTRGV